MPKPRKLQLECNNSTIIILPVFGMGAAPTVIRLIKELLLISLFLADSLWGFSLRSEEHSFVDAWTFSSFFILLIFPVRGHGVCSLGDFVGAQSRLRSDALPVTTIDFLGFEPTTHCAQIMYSNH